MQDATSRSLAQLLRRAAGFALISTACCFAGAGAAGGMAAGTPAVAITTGFTHTCALTNAGGAWCWGDNARGQVGDGTTTDRSAPVVVSGLSSGATAITAGGSHTCALSSGGGVLCWGANSRGQVGDGTTTDRPTPVPVSGLSSGVRAVSAGGAHTCALLAAGGLRCWGANGSGQLGDATTADRHIPVVVAGLSAGVEAIAAGGTHTCALVSGGRGRCWGSNERGQLGDGTTHDRPTPGVVSGLANGVRAIDGGGFHSCAITSDGGLECWGANTYGQLGDATMTRRALPVTVSGLASGVTAVATGGSHTCAITAAGAARCWGYNQYGGVGDGTMTARDAPVPVTQLSSGVKAIAAGDYHSCALLTGGGIRCWGRNGDGQLGNGDVEGAARRKPISVKGFEGKSTDPDGDGLHGANDACPTVAARGIFDSNHNGCPGPFMFIEGDAHYKGVVHDAFLTVTRLWVTRVPAQARATFSSAHGTDRVRANGSGTARSRRAGRGNFGYGSVIKIRITKPAFVGELLRMVITRTGVSLRGRSCIPATGGPPMRCSAKLKGR